MKRNSFRPGNVQNELSLLHTAHEDLKALLFLLNQHSQKETFITTSAEVDPGLSLQQQRIQAFHCSKGLTGIENILIELSCPMVMFQNKTPPSVVQNTTKRGGAY
eukprot:2305172-Rhodomonas_salina.1